jgi:arsenate reductase (thioredoxin)
MISQGTGKMPKPKILFLCTGNSCRSQMAEGWTKALKFNLLEAYSAGIQPKGIDPRAIQVMAEIGVHISNQTSKDIDSLENLEFDYVVTLCDNARESCPFFPAKTKKLHKGFDDPPFLSSLAKTEEEALAIYRRVRDEIGDFIKSIPESLG